MVCFPHQASASRPPTAILHCRHLCNPRVCLRQCFAAHREMFANTHDPEQSLKIVPGIRGIRQVFWRWSDSQVRGLETESAFPTDFGCISLPMILSQFTLIPFHIRGVVVPVLIASDTTWGKCRCIMAWSRSKEGTRTIEGCISAFEQTNLSGTRNL